MNNTIRPEFLSPDDFSSIWTDDENLSDCDPLADHAAFVAYVHADNEVDEIAYILDGIASNVSIRWITELARRVSR